ncbi:MAG TPA: DsbA family protein [Verrucomicrobiae bacterium]|jgi:predicted DsbA family dithiol-disulfide isomerase|nr:DsbA family protein [Verrucomicrobiae bacterium]
MVKVIYYTEVISSWCYWAEPAWAELKKRYSGRVQFEWRIALCDATGLPASKSQEEWFYRRSGMIARATFMLNTGWMEQGLTEYLVPNVLAEAAKDFGVSDDRVRLALMHAAMREGHRVNRWEESLPVAANAAGISISELEARAKHPEIEKRVRESTAEFHRMQATQRPTFVLQNGIGDKAMLSGIWTAPPIAAVIEGMIEDERSYASWAAYFGTSPPA